MKISQGKQRKENGMASRKWSITRAEKNNLHQILPQECLCYAWLRHGASHSLPGGPIYSLLNEAQFSCSRGFTNVSQVLSVHHCPAVASGSSQRMAIAKAVAQTFGWAYLAYRWCCALIREIQPLCLWFCLCLFAARAPRRSLHLQPTRFWPWRKTRRTYVIADYLSNFIQHPTQKVWFRSTGNRDNLSELRIRPSHMHAYFSLRMRLTHFNGKGSRPHGLVDRAQNLRCSQSLFILHVQL